MVDTIVSAVSPTVWALLIIIAVPSLLAFVSIAIIASLAARASGGSFNLVLPFNVKITADLKPNNGARGLKKEG